MVEVPTKEEFDALTARVAALETGGGEQPPTNLSLVQHIEQSISTMYAEQNPVWADWFSDVAIDVGKWNVIDSDYGTSNGERQCYDTWQATASNGTLKLTASDQDKSYNGKTYPFRSGMVTTRQLNGGLKYKRAYGYWEVEAKAPHGDAYWPAFWLVGPSDGSTPGWPDYGEFDIVEWNGVRPDVFFQTFHYKGKDGAHKHTSDNVQNLKDWDSESTGTKLSSENPGYLGATTNWHQYGFWWEPGLIAWIIDGKVSRIITADDRKYYKVNSAGEPVELTTLTEANKPLREIFAYPHSIILNLAIGGEMPEYNGYPGDDKVRGSLPSALEVKFVRVYDNSNYYKT